MNREEWLNERRKGIGGSDAAAICGVSPWKSPYQVYLEKIGESPEQADNDAMFWGRTLEPVIRQRYADVTGKEVVVPNTILQHPDIKFMLANLDGEVPGERVVEIKTARSDQDWGEPGTNEIPDTYMLQVQHYLIVRALPVADVAALFHGNDFRIYEVPADKELQNLLITRESEFWNMVQNATPPDPTTFADIRQKWGGVSKAVEVVATPQVTAIVEELARIKELKKTEKDLQTQVMAYLKDADTLIHPIDNKPLVTWKLGKPSKRLDTAALKAEKPEIYEQFGKEGAPSRRFLIK
jgi:putative phage-type endonuclease